MTDNTRKPWLPPRPREPYRLTEEERAVRARESAAAQQKP
jgi:hypothetical protein